MRMIISIEGEVLEYKLSVILLQCEDVLSLLYIN